MILVYILYDSMNNSIFASQVWSLLLKIAAEDKYQSIILISFESQHLIHNYHDQRIKTIQIKRYKYLGRLCLLLDLFKLKKYLPKSSFEIIARGPFAGWLATKSITTNCTKVTIQARGLAAEEYAYSTPTPNLLRQILVTIRYYQLLALEKKVYRTKHPRLYLESVSTALQDYLIKSYGTTTPNLTLAQTDIPNQINSAQILTWRNTLRKKLAIAPTTIVYCYSGSTHQWQRPTETVQFFQSKLIQNEQAFLLVLTPQPALFTQLIQSLDLPTNSYLVLTVAHHEIYQYLAAADFGLLFREKHILNWVSRPTKALEYQSVNLPILHNNTIAYLISK